MNDILRQCLGVIDSESVPGAHFSESFDHSKAVLTDMGEADIANRLWDLVGNSGRTEAIAHLIGFFVWITSDNGSEIGDTLNQWLRDVDSEEKCYIALHNEFIVLDSLEEAARVLPVVAARYPKMAEVCAYHLDEWRRYGPDPEPVENSTVAPVDPMPVEKTERGQATTGIAEWLAGIAGRIAAIFRPPEG